MRLVWSTEDFEYGGRNRPLFPIILNDQSEFHQPFQDFLLSYLIDKGTAYAPLTWDAYGRRLWDYARFLHSNQLAWNDPFLAPGHSPMARYRDWSCHELQLDDTTVSSRLSIVRAFYEWAKEQNMIDRLPFSYLDARPAGRERYGKTAINLQPPKWEKDAEFLTQNQIRALRQIPHSPTRRILLQLALRVGLRSCEARSFPIKYVFDPAKRKELSPNQLIGVRLDPRDMHIKYRKPRVVDVPYSLMSEMHQYTLFERNRLAAGGKSNALLLTASGTPFTKSSVVQVFESMKALVGFRVTALMLRHSFAIHTLMRLHSDPNYVGVPLLYVRDRLGHESVETTMKYLRQIERLAGEILLAANDEIDELFRS